MNKHNVKCWSKRINVDFPAAKSNEHTQKNTDAQYILRAKSKYKVGRNSEVGIPTRYGLDGSGIESWWEPDFPHPSRPTLGPIQPPVQYVTGRFPGDKSAGAWR